jgi:hypothetical protein
MRIFSPLHLVKKRFCYTENSLGILCIGEKLAMIIILSMGCDTIRGYKDITFFAVVS